MPQFRDMRGRSVADPSEDTSQVVRSPLTASSLVVSDVDREVIAAAVTRVFASREADAPDVAPVGIPDREVSSSERDESPPLDLDARIAALEERVSRLEHPMGKPFKRRDLFVKDTND